MRVFHFNRHRVDGGGEDRTLLGGKGANLAEMAKMGLPIPPGFTLSTEVCQEYWNDQNLNSQIKASVLEAISLLENVTEKKFGGNNPLLLSVRSGARVSMPGMMDTILNLGLNQKTVEKFHDGKFAWDSYRRFIQMYANVVLEINHAVFDQLLDDLKEAREVEKDSDLLVEDFKELVSVYKQVILEEKGESFPEDPFDQLWGAISSVFKSWNNKRANKYRELNGYSHDWGTAVNIQSMVFGNLNENSGTGVAFTRHPSTGEKIFFGEYLMNAQGEDVVAGIRTPAPINRESRHGGNQKMETLEELHPSVYQQLVELQDQLEKHFKDMQDIEFTVEDHKVFLLQTRNGKRTAKAAMKICVDLVREGILTKREAILSVGPDSLSQLLHPCLDPSAAKKILGKGLPASPGGASGKIYFDSDSAEKAKGRGEKVLLVRKETSPEDIAGMIASQGILTTRGGMTSHAAVVARGMGRPCVVGFRELEIRGKQLFIGELNFQEGDFLTIDGATGEVIEGKVSTKDVEFTEDFYEFMSWVDKERRLKVRTNADNPTDSLMAIKFGAEGIGLCRTEHMFFGPKRVRVMRKMIMSKNKEERMEALESLLPFQKEDFIEIFEVMDEKPVNIRLLDPPLHEFMPHSDDEKLETAKYMGVDVKELDKRGQELFEFNPMLGHRGCRLGISYPEIYIMQLKAIALAAVEVTKKGIKVHPEIMIPLVFSKEELSTLRKKAVEIFEEIKNETRVDFSYKVGTMIELPRAALVADELAEEAEFFSFGTNDLTQTTLGLSRDDSGKFLPEYLQKKILSADPFVTIDQKGVGKLVEMAALTGKKERKDIGLGICGEHGGDPQSVAFCHKLGLDYVSCSPYRVPIARLAAAQAAIRS